MLEVIEKIHKALNMIKDFKAGYKGSDAQNGYMLIEHKGRRYAVKMVEMSEEDQIKDAHDAVDNIKEYFKDD